MKTGNKKIRLNSRYITTIKSLAKRYFNTNKVYIFGSRADMGKKGGDIDIFLQTDTGKNLLERKIAFLREFEKECGEQRVDLVVRSKNDAVHEIDQAVKERGVKI